MKNILVWETLSLVSGGQKMTLTVMDLLKDEYSFYCLLPEKGEMADELDKRGIPYTLMGNQTLPIGIKGKKAIFTYAAMSLRSIKRSMKAIRQWKPDVLYAPGPAALPWSAVCGSLSHRPVVWHLHHLFLDGMTKKLLNMCSKWKSVKRIIAVSEVVGNQISNSKGHNKVRVIYNPVDVAKYESGSAERVRPEFEKLLPTIKEEGSIVILHVALIQRLKKQDKVLECVKILRDRGINACAIFAGECREADFKAEADKYIADNELDNYVVFAGRRNDIPDLLKLADVVPIIASFEGFPLAGLEACAAGTPVVAADVGGAKEFIDVSGNGCTFEFDNAESMANSILSCANRKKYYLQHGKSFALDSTYEVYSKKIINIYDEI